jgi:F0F1-type ATP synthase membrane subunit c/vacuolar-type H+-ATPase subunit K
MKIILIQSHFLTLNPSLVKQLFDYAILGFDLIEDIVLFALMMTFLILFIKKNWC